MFTHIKSLIMLIFATSCSSTWEIQDVDGDGKTLLDGDCWDSALDPVPPDGALDYGITALDIGPESEDLPYDGIDQNCDGKDDFDQDEDGYVPEQYAEIATQIEEIVVADNAIRVLMIEGTGELPSGDCFDRIPDDGIPEDFLPLGEFESFSPEEVYPNQDDLFYDGIDQNCDGNATEFDADGDGQRPANGGATARHYCATEHDGAPTGPV